MVKVTVALLGVGNGPMYRMEGRIIGLGGTREKRDSGKRSFMRWERRG